MNIFQCCQKQERKKTNYWNQKHFVHLTSANIYLINTSTFIWTWKQQIFSFSCNKYSSVNILKTMLVAEGAKHIKCWLFPYLYTTVSIRQIAITFIYLLSLLYVRWISACRFIQWRFQIDQFFVEVKRYIHNNHIAK